VDAVWRKSHSSTVQLPLVFGQPTALTQQHFEIQAYFRLHQKQKSDKLPLSD
jgi:hypothetical protein